MPAPTNGLILFWNCETLDGADMDDLSTTGNNGTIASTVNRPAGKVGAARGFDGLGGIKAQSAPSMSSYTVLVWAKPTMDARLALGMDTTGNLYLHYGVITANKFGYTHRSGGTFGLLLEAGSANATGAYHHIAARYNGHTAYFFRNGVTQASIATNGTTTISSFELGRWAGHTVGWVGDLDELRVYNRPLSLSEIQDVYNDTTNYPVVGGAGAVRDRERMDRWFGYRPRR